MVKKLIVVDVCSNDTCARLPRGNRHLGFARIDQLAVNECAGFTHLDAAFYTKYWIFIHVKLVIQHNHHKLAILGNITRR